MGLYHRVILPRLCHCAMRSRRLLPFRERTIAAADGRVLELGVGSGLNLPLYPARVREVIALEPQPTLIRMARQRVPAASSLKVRYLQASAEAIPLETHSVDCIVSTWTLCSITDVRHALTEMRRVLSPQGRLLFVEHGLAPEPRVQEWQHRLTPPWRIISGGCHLDRSIAKLIETGGFRLDHLETGYIPGPRIMTFLYEGSARPR